MSERVPDEVYSTDGPTCPHCAYEITPDEGCYYDDDYTEQNCPDCGLTYTVSVFTQTSWTTSPTPIPLTPPTPVQSADTPAASSPPQVAAGNPSADATLSERGA